MQSQKIDLVLVDVHMPQFSIISFSNTISTKWPHTAIIAISADDSVASIASCLEKGVILDYIVKPMVEKEVKSLYRY